MTLNLQKYINFLFKLDTKEKLTPELKKIYDSSLEYSKKIQDPYYQCNDKLILEIFEISWSGEQHIISENLIFYTLTLYWLDVLDLELYSSILQELYTQNSITNDFIVASYWMYWEKQRKEEESTKYSFYSFLEYIRKMGIDPIDYQAFASSTNNLFPNIELKEKEADIGNEWIFGSCGGER